MPGDMDVSTQSSTWRRMRVLTEQCADAKPPEESVPDVTVIPAGAVAGE